MNVDLVVLGAGPGGYTAASKDHEVDSGPTTVCVVGPFLFLRPSYSDRMATIGSTDADWFYIQTVVRF